MQTVFIVLTNIDSFGGSATYQCLLWTFGVIKNLKTDVLTVVSKKSLYSWIYLYQDCIESWVEIEG